MRLVTYSNLARLKKQNSKQLVLVATALGVRYKATKDIGIKDQIAKIILFIQQVLEERVKK